MAPATPPFSSRPARRAFTLVEMMVAIAIVMFVGAGIMSCFLFSLQSFMAMGNYTDLDRNSDNALDTLSRDIRSSYALTSFATNKIVISNLDTTTITYQWKASTGNLVRATGSTETTLLTGCNYLNFNIFQRNPTNNFTFISSSGTPSETKLINVSWRCSRMLLYTNANTESVQTAMIVIRN